MATNFEIGIPITFKTLGGGLNSTSGPLAVDDSEASDLQNIEFDKFGSILKRNGYTVLNTTAIPTGTSQGLYWYTSLYDRNAITVNSGKIYKMDSLDGGWDDITGAVSFATGAVDTNTKLLLHCEGADGIQTFTDVSISAHTVTINGNVQIDTAQFKFGLASGLFDGTGDYLTVADHADWNYGTGDFTIDCQLRFNSLVAAQGIYSQGDAANNWFGIYWSVGGTLTFYFEASGVAKANYTATWAPSLNTWYHFELVRDGASVYIFIDGVALSLTEVVAISTNAVPDYAASISIGYRLFFADQAFNGWIDEFRISKGIARHTANFTPPAKAYGDYLQQDFETFLGTVIGGDNESTPWQWVVNNSTASTMTVVSGLTGAKFIKRFQNYLFMANVKISGVKYPSRFYWSAIRSISSWSTTDWIEVSKDDGDEITGLKVLGDRLVIYKNNSIHIVIFTGIADTPFIVQPTNSAVGCVAPYSIQAVDNGHIFVAQDGIYFFDGNNSFKMSDRIADTFNGLNLKKLPYTTSMYQRNKNRYLLSCSSGTSLENNFVLTWNSYLNSWSKYTGISAASMAIFMVDGSEERPYFADYLGYTYRLDTGTDDYPANTKTAIDCSFLTNWKSYDTICDNKGVPHIYIVHRNETSTNLTLNYSYDFYNGDQYTQTFSLFTTQTVTAHTIRRDLTGRGRFVRFEFANNQTSTSFRIDGLGTYVTKESKT